MITTNVCQVYFDKIQIFPTLWKRVAVVCKIMYQSYIM